MLLASVIILVVMLSMAGLTLAAFSWAAEDKQFENLKEGSQCIFDLDEPIGQPTDPYLIDKSKAHNNI